MKTGEDSTEQTNPQQVTQSDVDDLALSLALLVRDAPELALVAEAWAELPEAVRSGIVAMVNATREF